MVNDLLKLTLKKVVSKGETEESKRECLQYLNLKGLEELENLVNRYYDSLAKKNVNEKRDLYYKEKINVLRLISEYVSLAKPTIKSEKTLENEKKMAIKKYEKKLRTVADFKKIVEFMIENNLSVEELNNEYGYSRSNFTSNLKVLEEIDNEFYQVYLRYMDNLNQRKVANLTKILDEVVNKIENGVVLDEEKNITRLFTLFDYYCMFDMPLEKLAVEERKYGILNEKYRRLFSTFVFKNQKSDNSLSQLLGSKLCFNVDDNVRLITKNEKNAVLEFMIENNLPQTAQIFVDILKLYLNNQLFISIPKTDYLCRLKK